MRGEPGDLGVSRTYSATSRGKSSISAEEDVDEMERWRKDGMQRSSLLPRT
jgi:hypothetical protein